MNKDRNTKEPVTDSSGNIFADLGLQMSEQDMLKVTIASAITKVIQKKGLTQSQAGELIGLDQPKVSALVRGNLDQFSVDRLFLFLAMLGLDVNIRIAKEPKDRRGKVTVAA